MGDIDVTWSAERMRSEDYIEYWRKVEAKAKSNLDGLAE
jgi:hypothetical protein